MAPDKLSDCATIVNNRVGLRDIQQKRRRIYSLMESLPEPNKTTFYYMLDHIIK